MYEANVVLTENISQRRTPVAMFVSNSSRAWQIWRSLGGRRWKKRGQG